MSSLLRSLVSSRLRTVLPQAQRTLATAAESSSAASGSSAPTPEASSSSSSTPAKWTPYTQRTGLIARKRGMTTLWDQEGKKHAVTVLQVDDCQVVHTETLKNAKQHKNLLQLGATNKLARRETKPMLGHFAKNGVEPKYEIRTFRVSDDAVLPVGTTLSAAHFVPGQYVDVTAKGIGKGFQGVMKRWGFRGLPASHGVTLKHRSGGSTGGNQDPGRVFKGKKMAGRMGGKQITTQNLLVQRIDTALNLIFVRGAVPGSDDAYIVLKDAVKNVKWRANKAFLSGSDESQWIGGGVESLPMPTVTVEDVKKDGWPEIIEWVGEGDVAKAVAQKAAGAA